MESFLSNMFLRGIKRGLLHVTFASGRRQTFGDGTGEALAIRFTDAAAERALWLDPALALAELYADGRLVLEAGPLYELIALFKRHARSAASVPAMARYGLRYAASYARSQISLEASARNVAHHYDLDERMYRLFLDEDMQYSCAYWETPEQTLEGAQLAKKRHIAGKLLLSPGQRVLDMGCGWGGMGLYLGEVAECNVTGITLSQPQCEVSQRRAAERGLDGRVRFQRCDYRQAQGRYDRIVSVGLLEHVGLHNYDDFFQTAKRCLEHEGVMVVHSMGRTLPRPAPSPFIDKYVFPGSYIPALSEVLPAVERAGFLVTDIEILPLHYAFTLREWRRRFLEHEREVLAMYDARFMRMWEFYLAASECGFRMDRMFVFHLQLTRPQHVVPIRRDYLLDQKLALRRRERECPAYASLDTPLDALL